MDKEICFICEEDSNKIFEKCNNCKYVCCIDCIDQIKNLKCPQCRNINSYNKMKNKSSTLLHIYHPSEWELSQWIIEHPPPPLVSSDLIIESRTPLSKFAHFKMRFLTFKLSQ